MSSRVVAYLSVLKIRVTVIVCRDETSFIRLLPTVAITHKLHTYPKNTVKMQRTFAFLVAAGAVLAKPVPAGVSSAISPSGSAPAGCSSSYPGKFEITVVNVTTAKRGLSEVRCPRRP